MKSRRLACSLCVVAACIVVEDATAPSAPPAQIRFVDPVNGSDSNTGLTPDMAWRTMPKAGQWVAGVNISGPVRVEVREW